MIYKIKAQVYNTKTGKQVVYFYSFDYFFAWVKMKKDFSHVYWMNVYYQGGYKNYTSNKPPTSILPLSITGVSGT